MHHVMNEIPVCRCHPELSCEQKESEQTTEHVSQFSAQLCSSELGYSLLRAQMLQGVGEVSTSHIPKSTRLGVQV